MPLPISNQADIKMFTASFPQSWIPARGAPVVALLGSAENGYAGMLFDTSASESVDMFLEVPQGATSVDVEIWWTNAAAGTGTVAWSLQQNKNMANGVTLNTTDGTLVSITPTAPAQHVLTVTVLKAGLAVVAGTNIIRVSINRGGGTLANDAALLAVILRRVA